MFSQTILKASSTTRNFSQLLPPRGYQKSTLVIMFTKYKYPLIVDLKRNLVGMIHTNGSTLTMKITDSVAFSTHGLSIMHIFT